MDLYSGCDEMVAAIKVVQAAVIEVFMSRVMRKPDYAYAKNKGADQLHDHHAAFKPIEPASIRPPFSKIFSSKTAWPIKAKFYVEPPWEGGTKVCINGPGHMTKMATTPIYGKNPSKIFSGTGGPISTKLGM